MVEESRPSEDVAGAVLVVGVGVVVLLYGWIVGKRGALVNGAARDVVGSVGLETWLPPAAPWVLRSALLEASVDVPMAPLAAAS